MISGELQLLALSHAGTDVALAMNWTQTIVILISLYGCGLWLHIDLINFRSEMRREIRQFRADMQRNMQQLRSDIQGDLRRLESKVDGLDGRLRAFESEQSRVAGLLEGLGLAGALPGDEG